MFAAVAIYGFTAIYLVCYLCVAGRAVARFGARAYLRWIPLRDFRVFVGAAYILAWLAALALDIFLPVAPPPWVWAVACTPFIAVGRGLLPPQILLLHTFDERNYPFGEALCRATNAGVVSLYPGGRTMAQAGCSFWRSSSGLGARFASDEYWREMVQTYAGMAQVIVMDVSHARPGLLEEMRFLSDHPEWLEKLVLVGRDDAAVGHAAAEANRILPAAHGRYFAYGGDAPSGPLENWGKCGQEIGARFRPPVPLWLAIAAVVGLFAGLVLQCIVV